MSAQLFSDLRLKLSHIRDERNELVAFRKVAFMPSPAMPQGPPPPMDPAMAQGGMPPMDPATGMPIDPSIPGAPPAESAAAPPLSPEAVDQILGLLEEMGQQLQGLQQESQQFRQQVEQALNELGDQLIELDQRAAATSAPPL